MSDPIGIRRGIRNTKRAAEVIAVLAKHGFRQFLSDTGIERMIERGQESLLRSKPEAATPAKPFAIRVREALEELGGTFIALSSNSVRFSARDRTLFHRNWPTNCENSFSDRLLAFDNSPSPYAGTCAGHAVI